jgi:hypothetical protein
VVEDDNFQGSSSTPPKSGAVSTDVQISIVGVGDGLRSWEGQLEDGCEALFLVGEVAAHQTCKAPRYMESQTNR